MGLFICLLVIFVFCFALIAFMNCKAFDQKSSERESVLSTKDGLYRKNPKKGYVTPVEAALLGREKAMEAIDISKIDVESFGRRRGAFGKFGYCVTNPICMVNLGSGGLKRYISNLCKDGSSMESFKTTEIFGVSLFDKPVYRVKVIVRSSHQEIYLHFIDSTYENLDELPEGFRDYSLYLKQQSASKDYGNDYPRFSLRGDRSRIGTSYSLIAFENTMWREVKIKTIWKG